MGRVSCSGLELSRLKAVCCSCTCVYQTNVRLTSYKSTNDLDNFWRLLQKYLSVFQIFCVFNNCLSVYYSTVFVYWLIVYKCIIYPSTCLSFYLFIRWLSNVYECIIFSSQCISFYSVILWLSISELFIHPQVCCFFV